MLCALTRAWRVLLVATQLAAGGEVAVEVTGYSPVAAANETRGRPPTRTESRRGAAPRGMEQGSRPQDAMWFRDRRQLPSAFERSSLRKHEYGEHDGRTLRNNVPDATDRDSVLNHLRERARIDGADPNLTSVSVFFSVDIAEWSTTESLRRSERDRDMWLRGEHGEERAFHRISRTPVGLRMDIRTGEITEVRGVTIVLRRTRTGGYALVEAFPDAVQQARYKPGRYDVDLRGTGASIHQALERAFKETGYPRHEFEITQEALTRYGKTVPVEWKHPSGAEVNVDYAHDRPNRPDVPHVGYMVGAGHPERAGVRGHILLDDVPYSRQ